MTVSVNFLIVTVVVRFEIKKNTVYHLEKKCCICHMKPMENISNVKNKC